MDSSSIIEKRVTLRINNEVGSNFKNIFRASFLIEFYDNELLKLSHKFNRRIDFHGSSFKLVMEDSSNGIRSINFEMEKIRNIINQIDYKIKKTKEIMKAIELDLDKCFLLDNLLAYLKILENVQETSNALVTGINNKDESKMVNIYLNLYENYDSEHCVIGRLSDVDAPFLMCFAKNTAIHWHSILKDKFSIELEAILKSMHWGQKDGHLLTNVNSGDLLKAQYLAEYLFLLKSPQDECDEFVNITSTIICQPITVVTKVLLKPYKKRFLYHFNGVRQTNRLDKPEWYYTQVLNWGKDTHLFVGKVFQSSAVKAGKIDFNIRLEFLRGLVQLTMEKLAIDIEEISCDEILFAHLLDETLAFESEIREIFGYPASFPSAITIITQPIYLLKWISLEERFCAEKMDSILQDENPWGLINPNISEDTLKIPKCADQFIRLLEAVKDRYGSLLQPGHQLQFLNLQLELIESFRIRLVQLHSNGLVDSLSILNAINYITLVLREWGENVHYLHLHAALVGPNAHDFKSVFENPINELEHWALELINSIAIKAVNEVKAKSMPYRRDTWFNMSEQHIKEPLMLSQSAGEMFQILVTTLHNLEDGLSVNHFNLALRLIAKQFDTYMYDSMILNTKFSAAGAAQFDFDLRRNLYPIFGQYNKKPEIMLKRLHDANKLLNCMRGTALLIYETLKDSNSLANQMKIIRELGIVYFKPHHCIEVIERRADLKII